MFESEDNLTVFQKIVKRVQFDKSAGARYEPC